MGFFDDITIPCEWMKEGASEFNVTEGVWVWKIEAEEEGDEATELFIDAGELIRFRVESESFVDVGPADAAAIDVKQPYSLAGSISEDGLGLESWWE
jgi:DNA-directed RNA polymerase III subunit RPC8